MKLFIIKTEYIYNLFVLIYLLSLKYFTIEVSYLISLFLFFSLLFKANKFNKLVLFIVLGLLLITVIGIMSSFFNPHIPRDFIKDFVYFTKPILVVINTYKLISLLKNKQFLIKSTIYIGLIGAIFHLLALIYFIPKIGFHLETLRHTIIGQGNILETLALSFLIVKDKKSQLYVYIKHKILIIFLLFISILFYFSRTDLIVLIILVLGLKGFFKPRVETIYFIVSLFTITFLFIYSLSFFDLKNNNGSGIKRFLHKIENSSKEIFSKNIKRTDTYAIHSNWRAYEANQAINQIKEGNQKDKLIGIGFGGLVDLKLKIYLGAEEFRYIPVLHNGYAYIYFKTGIIGLISYLIVFISVLFFGLKKKIGDINSTYLIVAITLSILFTTLIIRGIYGGNDLLLFYLIGIITIYHSTLKISYE